MECQHSPYSFLICCSVFLDEKVWDFIISKKKFKWLLIWKKLYFLEWNDLDMTWWILFTFVVSLISFFVELYTHWCKDLKILENGNKIGNLRYWGFVLYSAQLPFFLGVFPGKEGRMNLEVSKSNFRCVATRQLVSKHQLTFLCPPTLHGLHQVRNWTRGMFLPPQLPPSIRVPCWT